MGCHGRWCDGTATGGGPRPDIEHLYELLTSRGINRGAVMIKLGLTFKLTWRSRAPV